MNIRLRRLFHTVILACASLVRERVAVFATASVGNMGTRLQDCSSGWSDQKNDPEPLEHQTYPIGTQESKSPFSQQFTTIPGSKVTNEGQEKKKLGEFSSPSWENWKLFNVAPSPVQCLDRVTGAEFPSPTKQASSKAHHSHGGVATTAAGGGACR